MFFISHRDALSGNEPIGAVVAHVSGSRNIESSVAPCFFSHAMHSGPHALRSFGEGVSSPYGNFRPSEPRAAYSHSALVGRCLPSALQKRSAMFQSTQLIG